MKRSQTLISISTCAATHWDIQDNTAAAEGGEPRARGAHVHATALLPLHIPRHPAAGMALQLHPD